MDNRKFGTILIVDDQQSWRRLLINVLEDDGHTVTTANGLEEAKKQLETTHFDLAIIDMRLVDVDSYNIQGLEVLREVKEKYPDMKAIMLTGYPDEDQRAKAIDYYCADGYFEKVPDGHPLDVDKFSQLIFELLQS